MREKDREEILLFKKRVDELEIEIMDCAKLKGTWKDSRLEALWFWWDYNTDLIYEVTGERYGSISRQLH